ncbi:MAG: fimbrial subunit usher protein, partial [Proteobacteria bacterium]|nr:fimbrial subunit usher protein [Pseudomonadota bacterium]
ASGGESVQVFPPFDSVQMRRGSVKYIKVKAVKTFTLVGMLQDAHGNVLKNRYVRSDVSGGVINAEGVLTLDSGTANQKLTVRAENGQPSMLCALPSGMDRNKKVQFISTIKCRTTGQGEKK